MMTCHALNYLSALLMFFYAMSSVIAAPLRADSDNAVSERDVPTSVCTTIDTGILKTSLVPYSTAPHLHFVKNTLSFGGHLTVEFQSCQPNFGHYDGSAYDIHLTGGHLFVPSTGLCLTAKSLVDGPPFQFEEATCEYTDDSRQTFQQFVRQDDGIIYYAGNSQADGSTVFFGDQCALGQFGIDRTQTSGTVEFQCTNIETTIGIRLNP
ncbi:hypothetical protein DL93DRAFT_2075083 [Clavulina sp. PMI_390]|nr:hypothetical protein DL93DRAFT_2075083 [Clavulina sp. PMI_390]